MDTSRAGAFHYTMAALLVASTVADQQAIAGWPTVSIVTLGLAMAWLGRYAIDGFQRRDRLEAVLSNRLRDLEHRVDSLDRELQARRGPRLGGRDPGP